MVELALGRVVVARALKGLGDFLCVVPALRALRAASPQAHITLLGLDSSRALVGRFAAYVDELLPFPGFPGIPEVQVNVTRLPAFFAQAQARKFDLALQMHGNGTYMNPFTEMLGASATAGYCAPGAYCPDPERFLVLDEAEHEVERWLRLLEHLGAPPRGRHLEFPVQQSDRDLLWHTPATAGLRGSRYVAIHAGATEIARRWSREGFAAVANYFSRNGLRVVLTGTREEADIATDVAARMRYPAVNLAGRTDLGAMAALLEEASLLISNDTGVSHLAAALRVPSVVLFLASDPRRWAPLDQDLHCVVGRDGLQPDDISPHVVLHEAYRLLEKPSSARSGAAAGNGTHDGATADGSPPVETLPAGARSYEFAPHA
jgi:ADP-heptose:LPS heptosyltransferase